MNIFTRRQELKLRAIAGGSLLLPIALQQRSYAGDASSPRTVVVMRFIVSVASL